MGSKACKLRGLDPKPSLGSGLGSKCRKLQGLDPEPELEDDFLRRKGVRGPEVRGSGVQGSRGPGPWVRGPGVRVRGPRVSLNKFLDSPLLHFIMFQCGNDPKPSQIRGWPLVPGPGALRYGRVPKVLSSLKGSRPAEVLWRHCWQQFCLRLEVPVRQRFCGVTAASPVWAGSGGAI